MWTSKRRLSVNTGNMLNKLCREWIKIKVKRGGFRNVMITGRCKNKCEIWRGGEKQGDTKTGGHSVMRDELSVCRVAKEESADS